MVKSRADLPHFLEVMAQRGMEMSTVHETLLAKSKKNTDIELTARSVVPQAIVYLTSCYLLVMHYALLMTYY